MFPEITLREFIIGVGIFIGVSILSVSIAGYVRDLGERKFITVQQALKVDEPEKLQYGVKTNVGNILAYGSVKALEPQSMSEIKGEYAIIGRIEEHYTMHTTTYSCGKSTCTSTYWTWDFYSEDYNKSKDYDVMGVKLTGLCEPDTKTVGMDNYQGKDNHDTGYAYPRYHVRYYWKGAAINHTGTVFLRSFNDKITSPFNGSCIPFHENKDIKKVVEDSKPNNGLMTFLFIGLVVLITSVYFYFAYRDEIC